MSMTNEWLPIGSVVHLQNADRLVMIAGTMQQDESSHRLWDYMGFPYPEGSMNTDESLMFNTSMIDRVYFLGYQPLEGINYLELLKKNTIKFRKLQMDAASETTQDPASEATRDPDDENSEQPDQNDGEQENADSGAVYEESGSETIDERFDRLWAMKNSDDGEDQETDDNGQKR